jgi:altronate hydrolase
MPGPREQVIAPESENNQKMKQETVQSIASLAVIVDPEKDHAAVAKNDIPAGTVLRGLDGQPLTVKADVPAGHRFAIRSLSAGEWVCQYGQPFAVARHPHEPGDPITAESVENQVPHADPETIEILPPSLPPWEGPQPTFAGFRRADGRAGVRNWILIVPTSNCSSHEASMIAMQAEFSGLYSREKYPNVDGVTAIPHHRGCGCPDMVPAGTDGRRFTSVVEVSLRMLAYYIQHPNVAGALLIELGCEKTNLSAFNRFSLHDMDLLEKRPSSGPSVRVARPTDLSAMYGKPVYSLSIQGCGGTRATIQRGMELLPELLETANRFERTEIPVSELAIGLECGGSDAFSGLTANPGLGHASDLLVSAGGTSIISETPEFFGAEHLFARRAANRQVVRGIFDHIERYREYAARNGTSMSENPSPGNKEGGLLNITIKSLGAMAKAGTAPVQGVLDYAQQYWKVGGNGLYLMYGPGYDPESVPAMVAAGCQIVCFTTGRGSVLGNAIAPVIKIASNSAMYQRMSTDMDVNAGVVIDGTASLPELGRQIFDAILATASGQWTKAEENGHREFTIWSEEGISL